jgi:MFS family permease
MSENGAARFSAADYGQSEHPDLWTGSFVTYLFINLCIFMGFNMLLPTLSIYLEGQGLIEREIGLVFGSFTVSAVLSRLFASPLGKAFGSLWVARFGLFLCSIGTLFYFLHASIASYLFARLMQGAGFGLTSTLLVSLASQSIPHQRMAEGIGYLGLGATVSLALGPYAGIFMAEEFSFRSMFVSVSVCYLMATLVSFLLPKSAAKRPAAALPASARDAGSSASAAFAAAEAAKPSWIEKRAIPASILMLVYGMGISAVVIYLAIFCKEKSLPSAAVFFMVSTVGTIASRLYAGRIYDRYGHNYVIPPSIIVTSVAVVAIISEPSAPIMFSAAVLYGLGAGAAFPSIQTMALASVPPQRRTVASAYFFVAFDLGMGIGAVLMGLIAGIFHSYKAAFIGSLFFFGALFALYYILYPKKAAKRETEDAEAKEAAEAKDAAEAKEAMEAAEAMVAEEAEEAESAAAAKDADPGRLPGENDEAPENTASAKNEGPAENGGLRGEEGSRQEDGEGGKDGGIGEEEKGRSKP